MDSSAKHRPLLSQFLYIFYRREARSDKFSSIKEDENGNDDDKEDSQRKQKKEMINGIKLSRKRRERINTRREDEREEKKINSPTKRIGKQKQDKINSEPNSGENSDSKEDN